MQKLLIYILFLFFAFFPAILFGQLNNIEFEHYTANDGLSNGRVKTIFQDKKGYIWFGTFLGLNRFDGTSFKQYLFDSKDTTSISGNDVGAITEDSLGNIWIACSGGLSLYNRQKDNFSTKTFIINNNIYSNNIMLESCLIDSKGYLWLGSLGEIFRFKLYNNPQIYGKYINAGLYFLNETDLDRFNLSTTYSFVEDEKHNIWIATFSNKLFCFNDKQNKFIPYPINHPEAQKFSNKHKYMIKDHDGDFIITMEWNGVLVWYRKENKFVLFKPNGTNTGPSDNYPCGLTEDRYGQIWIASRNTGGVNIFNKKTGTFKYCLNDENNPNSISSNANNCVFEDKEGSIWIGAGRNNGINKYSPNKQKFKKYLYVPKKPDRINHNNILCLVESKAGDLWIGTDGGGLNKLNRKTGEFTNFIHEPSNPNSLSSNAIISIFEDHEGTLWLGTFNGGLVKMKGNNFHTYYPDPSNPYALSYMHIWYVFEDSKQNLWVGTLNRGIEIFDRKNERFYNYSAIGGDSTSLCNNSPLQIYEDSRNLLYITTCGGVSVLDLNAYDFSKMPPALKFKNLLHKTNINSLSSDRIYCVTEDKEKNIWFGTMSTGIDKLDVKTGKFTNFSTSDGLPGNSVNSILIDNNNLWLATDKGIAKFNPKTKKTDKFLHDVDFNGWALKTKDNEMFFGSSEGFYSFYPDKIKYNKNLPPVYITGLKIFNQKVKTGEKINGRIILAKDICETKKLVLTHFENSLGFDFIALNYIEPEKNQYAYMMAGFDKDWIKCGTTREASYTNLGPGNYIFRVKASNNDGIWNETGAALYITIIPPWWQTLWFRSIIILLIFIIIFITFHLRASYFKQKQREMAMMVKVRAQELKNSNELLLQRQSLIKDQADELLKKNTVLQNANDLLKERQLRINKQAERFMIINEQLLERSALFEKQSEELRIFSESQKETNELLVDRQKIILKQSEEMKEASRQLALLNATKDKIFSIIAHDLRNPFNTVSGFSDMIMRKIDTMPSEKVIKYLDIILAASKNGNILLENLLQWSRSQTGRISYEPTKLNLFAVAEEVIKLLGSDAERKHISILSFTDQNIIVNADENMIKTVLRNLISNAVKFTRENGTITLKSVINHKCAEVSIIDTGVGISKEDIGKLFHIDVTISTKGTANETGTGLGLILCKEFVEKHGGKIWVESEVGKGSKFKFIIPLA